MEFELLKRLVRDAGQVLTRRTLMRDSADELTQ
jgi:DNA-binding response OmpR family regulator